MTDCQEVAELLDSYVLGATDKSEAAAIESHVADCVRCWEELTSAQQTAASLALAVPMTEAPARLRERIMRKAEREGTSSSTGILSRLRLNRPWLAPVASFATGFVVLFAVFELQMDSLRGDNDTLEGQLASSDAQLKQVDAVLAAGDTTQLPLTAMSVGLAASTMCVYHWSPSQRLGFLTCSNLAPLTEGQTYQAWFTEDSEATPLGTCTPLSGLCQFPLDLSRIRVRADAIGVSVEPEGGSQEPQGGWIMYAEFEK